VLGFKCFLSPSGVPEFAHVSRADLDAAAPALARLGLPLLVHAEDPAALELATEGASAPDPRSYRAWLASRPPVAETMALALLASLARRHGLWIHVVHLASGDLWGVVRDGRAQGLRLSCETCPHYLTFAAEEIPDGAPLFKCAPPIREAAHRDGLWEGLRAGAIHLIATDHSPCPPELKRLDSGDVAGAWGGIASLELSLPVVWTGAAARGFTPADVVRWMSDGPSRLAGLHGRKGAIQPGADADLVVWDPDAEWTVDAARMHQRHKQTPYHGLRVRGRVHRTYVSGTLVFAEGEPIARAGEVLRRAPSPS
jgi:allantoinase